MVIVSDTTAISSFLRAGRQALLKDLFGTLVLPRAVARELDQAPELLGSWRERLPFVSVVEVPPSPILRLLLTELDSGEAEAICLAAQREAKLLVIDESAGRSVAKRFGLQIMGSVGILLLAAKRGLLPDPEEALEALQSQGGLWLSEDLVAEFHRLLACD